MLLKHEIQDAVWQGHIQISPYKPERLGPNSYDVSLGKNLLILQDDLLDPKKEPKTSKIVIPENGMVLIPNQLYLGVTVEYTSTPRHVPVLEGRSTLARFGVQVHQTAGFGDVGYAGHWTLEIQVIKPFIVYPGMRIAQLRFESVNHQSMPSDSAYAGNYLNKYSDDPHPAPPKAGNI